MAYKRALRKVALLRQALQHWKNHRLRCQCRVTRDSEIWNELDVMLKGDAWIEQQPVVCSR